MWCLIIFIQLILLHFGIVKETVQIGVRLILFAVDNSSRLLNRNTHS